MKPVNFVIKIIPRSVFGLLRNMKEGDELQRFAARFGFAGKLDTEDRRILEQTILPFFAARSEFRRVLFVGCDWYTNSYRELF